jgi:DNA-binding XRE family transcriptional regulator
MPGTFHRKGTTKHNKTKEIRLRRNWTQVETAVWCGVTLRTYIKCEQGHLNITLETWIRVALGLGVAVVDLLPILKARPDWPTSTPKRTGSDSPIWEKKKTRKRSNAKE